MSTLKVFNESDSSLQEEYSDFEKIRERLDRAGVIFERWQAEKTVSDSAGQDEILSAYKSSVDRLMQERGFLTADVVSLHAGVENHQELRKKFLAEHVHSEDEARFFIDGRGLFYIHIGSEVFAVMCEAGDLINVPEGTKHWFDMGAEPFFKCIRVFTNKTGWEAKYTGSSIADNIPVFEKF